MTEQPKWRRECTAAIGIIDRSGDDAALGYLIGDKFSTFLWAADRDPSLAGDVLFFAQAIKSIFAPSQVRAYLDRAHRLGPLAHAATDEQYEALRTTEAVEGGDLDDQLHDIIRIEQIKKLLL